MAKKKQDTGIDLKEVKNFVGTVIMSLYDEDSVMIRTEVDGSIMTYVIISIEAAQSLGIDTLGINPTI
jgi:hypothetical protein